MSTQRVRYAASYARKSDPNDDGLRTQHKINRRAASALGYVIPDEFLFGDDDTTGVSTSRDDFDALQKLVESESSPFEAVFVRNTKRFGRWNDVGYHDYLRIHFQKNGVKLLFSEGANPDYSKGMTNEVMVASVSQRFEQVQGALERTDIRKRTMTGARHRVIEGFYPGSLPPYATERWLAHEKTHELLQPVPQDVSVRKPGYFFQLCWSSNESEIEAVRKIFQWMADERCTYAEIARRLNDQGYPPPNKPTTRKKACSERGSPRWRSTAVRYILQNPIYVGDFLWARSRPGDVTPHDQAVEEEEYPIIHRGFMPEALVSRELYDRVQEIIDGNGKKGAQRRERSNRYLLSGILECAQCGAQWYGHGRPDKDLFYYRHAQPRPGRVSQPVQQQECPHRNRYVRQSAVEGPVIEGALDHFRTPEIEEEIAAELQRLMETSASAAADRQVKSLETNLRNLKGQLDRLIQNVAKETNGAVLASYDRAKAATAEQIEHLEEQLTAVRQRQGRARRASRDLESAMGLAHGLLGVFENAPAAQKKLILSQLIESIPFDPETGSLEVRLRLPPRP